MYRFIMKIFYNETICSHCKAPFFVDVITNEYEQCCSYNCDVNAMAVYLSQKEKDNDNDK